MVVHWRDDQKQQKWGRLAVKSNLSGNVQNCLIKMQQLLIDLAIRIYFYVIIIYTCTDTEGLMMVTLLVIEL